MDAQSARKAIESARSKAGATAKKAAVLFNAIESGDLKKTRAARADLVKDVTHEQYLSILELRYRDLFDDADSPSEDRVVNAKRMLYGIGISTDKINNWKR